MGQIGKDIASGLIYAIKNKYEIVFQYGGIRLGIDPSYQRKGWRLNVQPVALGRNASSGRLILRAWQKKGGSNTSKPAWKTFIVDEITHLAVYDGDEGFAYIPFNSPDGPGYNPSGDKHMVNGKPDYMINLSANPGPNMGDVKTEPEAEDVEDNNTEEKSEVEPAINETFTSWINKLLLITN